MKKYSIINKIKPIQIFTFTPYFLKTNRKLCRDQLKGKSGLYGIINLVPNKNELLYIGRSINTWDRISRHSHKSHNTDLRNAIEKNGLHNFIIVVFIFDPSYSPPCLDFKLQDQIQDQNQNKNQICLALKGLGHFDFEEELDRLETKCIKSFDRKFLYNKKIKAIKKAKLSLEQYKNKLIVYLIIIPLLKALINKKN